MRKILFFILLFLCFPVGADVLNEPYVSFSESISFKELARTYHISPIFLAMGLTAIIETFLLWCFKYRGWKVLAYFFILNLISNFMVNVLYEKAWQATSDYMLVTTLELGVVIFEASLLGLMTGYNKKLWISVFLTNLTSFLTGVLLFGL